MVDIARGECFRKVYCGTEESYILYSTIWGNTDRPIIAEISFNEVVGADADKIIEFSKKALGGHWKESGIPELWDGRASERIVKIFAADLHG